MNSYERAAPRGAWEEEKNPVKKNFINSAMIVYRDSDHSLR